jgi:uncharacterized protein (UPF0210 family)
MWLLLLDMVDEQNLRVRTVKLKILTTTTIESPSEPHTQIFSAGSAEAM